MQYLNDPTQIQFTSDIVSSEANQVQFADTIIYPGGGGQPQDRAWLTQGNQRFEVLETTGDHLMTLDRPLNDLNIPIIQHIDGTFQQQNCAYHTLLHLIAAITAKAGAKVSSNQIAEDHARIECSLTLLKLLKHSPNSS